MPVIAAIVLLVVATPALAADSPRRPNVVLIMTDDQGYGDLGCTGNPVLKTPNLDRLSRESVRLTNFHVDPTCSPTRSALMTGRYSTRVGVWHTVMGRHMPRAGELMMPQVFAESGYATAIFGKWHLGDNIETPRRTPPRSAGSSGASDPALKGRNAIAWGNAPGTRSRLRIVS